MKFKPSLKVQIPSQNYKYDLPLLSPLLQGTKFSRGANKTLFHTNNPKLLYCPNFTSFELFVYYLLLPYTQFDFQLPKVFLCKQTSGIFVEKIHVKHHLKVSNDFYFYDVRYNTLIPEHLREKFVIAVAQFVAVCKKVGLSLNEFEVLIDEQEKIYLIDFENGSLNSMDTPTLSEVFWCQEDNNFDYYNKLYMNTLNETTNKF